jgi:hypothetical protein
MTKVLLPASIKERDIVQGVHKVLTLLKVYGLLKESKDFWDTLYMHTSAVYIWDSQSGGIVAGLAA